MGWIWATPPAPSGDKAVPRIEEERKLAPVTATMPPPSIEPEFDPELAKFIAEFREELRPKPKPKAAPAAAAAEEEEETKPSSLFSILTARSKSVPDEAPTATTTSKLPGGPTPESEALAKSLLPTTMSCSQAFDLAYNCQSIGGQFKAVYRHGRLEDCSTLWADWRFCMRTRVMADGAAKEDRIRDHYRQKELRKYGAPDMPSSEDVWTSRDRRIDKGETFNEPYEHTGIQDRQFQMDEMARRKEIRRHLGIED